MDEPAFARRIRVWRERVDALADGPRYPADLDPLFDDLCRIYLDALPDQRRSLPLLFADTEISPRVFERTSDWVASRAEARREVDRLLGYIGRIVGRVRGPDDAWLVRHGLAAADILDQRPDYRDIILTLQTLYERARRVGIDPAPISEEIERKASPETSALLRSVRTRSASAPS